MSEGFADVDLPHVGKRVRRLGVAGNYGLRTADIRHAAERGVSFWLWTPRSPWMKMPSSGTMIWPRWTTRTKWTPWSTKPTSTT